jgi:hypothetical protein
MSSTLVRKSQIRPLNIIRSDINTTTSGSALITKIIAGTGLTLSSSTGVNPGTGDVTVALSIATASTLGGVKIGSGLTIAVDGTISVTSASTTWGSITGLLSNQSDLWAALNAKYNNPTGTTLQYIDGTGALQDFPLSLPTEFVRHEVKAGVPINKGQAVYVRSSDGTNMIVELASYDAELTSSKTMGLIDRTLAPNDFGNVVTEGLLAGLDTTAAQAGDPVWLGPNGNLLYGIANKPHAPFHMVFLGIVTRVNANNGEIFVKVQNGYEIDELHDVLISSPATGQLLRRDSDGLWKNWTPNYLTSFTETDPTVPAHVKAITTTNISNWNTAYGWGNHAGLYSLLGHTHAFASLTSIPTTLAGYGITDAATSAQGAKADTAFSWGNHASYGYATQTYVNTAISNLVDTAPATLDTLNELAAALGDDPNFATTVTNNIATKVSKSGDTMTGNLNWAQTDRGITWGMNTDGAYIKFYNTGDGDTNSRLEYATFDNGDEYHRWMISSVERMTLRNEGLNVNGVVYSNGYGNSTQWIAAYNWGNHASAGYLTSFTETDPTVPAHVKAITATNISNWNTAYGWGNHATVGYLTSVTNISGNAGTATVLQTARTINGTSFNGSANIETSYWGAARTITIGNTGKTLNGSVNQSWSLAEIGAQPAGSYAAASHTHDDRYYTESESDARFAAIAHTHDLMRYSLRAPGNVDSLTSSNFRDQLFGTSSNGYAISTARWNSVPSGLSGMNMYGNMFAWSGSDTHGFIATDYSTANIQVGGGSGNSITWRATLIHSSNIGSQSVNYASSAGSVAWVNVSGRPTAVSSFTNDSGYITSASLSSYVPTSRTITINGVGYDLSANRSWTVSGTDNTKLPLTGGTMSGTIVLKSISGVEQTVPNEFGAYLHLGDWGIGRTDPRAVLVNTAYRADYADSLFDMNISRFTNNSGYITSSGSISGNAATTSQRSFDYLYASSYLESGGAVYGTIFYDNNDRTYYGDFNGTSKFYQAIVFGDSSRYSAVSTTINGTGAGDKLILYGNASNYDARVLVGADYDFIFKSQGSPAGKGIFRFYSGPSAALALEIRADQSTNVTGTVYSAAYRGNANVGGTGEASWHPAGIYSGGTQWFYGTTYRNSASTYGQGQIYFDSNYGYGLVGLYSSTRYQAIFAMGDAYKLPVDGTTTGSLYGLAWSHPNAGGVAGNLNTHGLLVMENGTFLAAISGSIRARDDVRAPALYDSGSRVAISRGEGRNYVDYSRYVYNNGAYSGSGWVEPSDLGVRYAASANYATSAGSANSVAWGNISSRPSWMTSASLIASHSNANEWRNSGFYENDGGGSNWPSGTWYNSINVRHSNQGNYHGFQVAMSYYDNLLWFRSYQGSGSFQSWAYAISNQNIGSQSVAYASNSGALNGWGYGSYAYRSSGSGYYQIDTWLQMNGSHGIYWPSYYGAHIYPNTGSSYTQLRIDGQKNGYGGMWDSYSAVNGMMYDGSGNGGIYREANGRWYLYHHVGNNCTAISTSTTSSSYRAYVGGSLYAEGDIVAYSDARKKSEIVTIDSALEKVKQLRGVYYVRTDETEKGRQTGVIAQEINEVLPEVVTYAEDLDEYGVKYGNIVGVLIEAIKEQQKEIEELKAKLN